MGHHWLPIYRSGIGLWWGSWPLLLVMGLGALSLVAVAIAAFSRRHQNTQWSEAEREVRENMDGQIRAMLYQAGGPLTQDRIRSNLDVSPDELAQTLGAMERRGEITREWLPLEYTYRIHLTPANREDIPVTGNPSIAPEV